MTSLDTAPETWRAFDGAWYRCAYPMVDDLLSRGAFSLPEEVYSVHGRTLEHSPNPFFHERWYLAKYQPVRDAVRAGEFQSGFDHFQRHGHHDLMPHWLFDPVHYRDQFQRAYGRVFDPPSHGDPYSHFLRVGQYVGLSGHWLFTAGVYAALAPHDVAVQILRDGAFTTFLLHVRAGGSEPIVSNLFDPVWYVKRYPAVAVEVGEGRWDCALHHYLGNDSPCEFDPSPRFSESDYVSRFPAVAAAIRTGGFRNGFDHFLRHGWAEGRFFAPTSPDSSHDGPVTARFPLRTRMFTTVTLLPGLRDPDSPTGQSFGVLGRDGAFLREFSHPRLAMRSNEAATAVRQPGIYIYGGVLTRHFGHLLTDVLARLWFLRQRPDLPVLWHWCDHPVPHDLWPGWMDQVWRLLGLDQHRHHQITSPITVDQVILPDSGIAAGSSLHERQARALAIRHCTQTGSGNKVWLSRSGLPAQFGRMTGERQVEEILTARGWEVLRPEERSVADQVDVFATAAVVAGCMGSAFHAVLMCATPRARLILIDRPGLERTFFDAVAQARNLRQAFIVPDFLPHTEFGPEASFTLADPGQLADAVCERADDL